MHDNAPSHKAKLVQAYLKKCRLTVLPWPPLSPDMNPLENVWNIMWDYVGKRSPNTKKDLERWLYEAWNKLHQVIATALNKMPYTPGNDNEKDGEDREEGADEGHREVEAEADPSSNALAIAVASALADPVLNDDQVYAGVVGPSLNPTIAGPIYEALPVYSGYVQPAYDQAGCSHAGNPQVGYSQEGYGQAALFTPGNVAMDTGQAFPALSQTVQFPVFHQPQAYSGMKYMQPVYYWSGTSTFPTTDTAQWSIVGGYGYHQNMAVIQGQVAIPPSPPPPPMMPVEAAVPMAPAVPADSGEQVEEPTYAEPIVLDENRRGLPLVPPPTQYVITEVDNGAPMAPYSLQIVFHGAAGISATMEHEDGATLVTITGNNADGKLLRLICQ
ncbi:hypothetical protein RvY_18729 [Ramazzottius varieornatus]|uniref:Tc1-like transposase DDE domain-containing protein n=1 Tax=Ramazzottius varieornatus TaxID=947166 RepID=A0A1D1W6V8_RAMVA|nr:hypothetical protein RvY_18729 [Ramazzottius varieornatus]